MPALTRRAVALLERSLVAIFAAFLLVVVGQVLLRSVLNESMFWSEEFIRFALVWTVMLGASVATYRQSHIRVDILDALLTPRLRRAQRIVSLVILLAFALVLCWSGLLLVDRTSGMTSATLGIEIWIVYAVIPFSAALDVLFLLLQLCDSMAGRAVAPPAALAVDIDTSL